MNKEKILEMIQPFIKNETLTYKDFNEIFKFLSQNEKDLIEDFLSDELKIILIDEENFQSAQEDFNFVDYVLETVKPYLENKQLTYDEFDEIFSHLERKDQYKVTDILDASDISLVDEKILYAQIAPPTENNFPPQPENIIPHKDYEIKASNAILLRLAQNGNRQALHDLIVKNRRLVLKYAGIYDKIYNHNLNIADLEQEGMLGILKAVENFDFSHETQFSTYAVYWIKQSILRAISDKGFTIHIPVHIFEDIIRLMKLDNKFSTQEEKFSARVKLIAEEMGISIDKASELFFLRDNYLNISSLDVPIGEENDSELKDFIENVSTPSPLEMLEEKILQETIYDLLDTLKERERQVLMLRFGLIDGKEHTLEEIGKKFGLTRERIRQIETKALKKLRHPSRSKKLKDFL